MDLDKIPGDTMLEKWKHLARAESKAMRKRWDNTVGSVSLRQQVLDCLSSGDWKKNAQVCEELGGADPSDTSGALAVLRHKGRVERRGEHRNYEYRLTERSNDT